jgi:signal transduction histidine kinase
MPCRAQSGELTGLKTSMANIKDSLQYVDALNRTAMLLYEKSVDSTFYYARQARQIASRLHYEKGNVDALNNLGICFDIKGNLQVALRYYDEAYNGYAKLHDTADCVQALMNIAMVYKEMGKDQKSIQQFNNALNAGRKLSKDSILSLVIFDYLEEFPNLFSRDSMNYYTGKARHIALKYKDERTLIALEQLVADEMMLHGNRDKGLALLNQTIETAVTKKLYYLTMDMLIDMGDKLAATDPARAVQYYQRGLGIAGKNGYLIYSQLIARKLFDFYTARNDSVRAAAYSRQLVALNDEQERLNNTSGIDYLDYALKEQEVNSLELRSRYETALLALAVIICLLAAFFIVLIRRTLQRTTALNAQITSQNIQMKTTLAALEQSQADNTRMMKIAAHDLRNPVGGIYSLSSMMLEEANQSEDNRAVLEMIKTSAQNSLELVDDLLQVQFNTEELKKEPVDISEMLHYCVSMLLNKAEAKNQRINLVGAPVVVPANREKLWRVMSNLIGNAIKFSPPGAVIDVKVTNYANHIVIAVKDNGIGIPADMRDKIFDMFTEARRTGTAGEQAFGFGAGHIEADCGSTWRQNLV